MVLKVKVHTASVMDRDGIKLLLAGAEVLFPRFRHLWLDAGYKGKGKDWVERTLGWTAKIVRRSRRQRWVPEGVELDWNKILPPEGFIVLPRRWVVERTIAWVEHNRRMSKDYERLPESGEAFIYVAMTRLMARHLART